MRKDAYIQRLPALELSIERYTDSVPADGWWYLLRAGETIGRFRSRQQATAAWAEVIATSGWRPEKTAVDPKALLVREATMRENERWHEYWGSSHKFRARGGIHKNR